MKESTRFASFLLIVLFIATAASGQGTTGALTGNVTHLSEPLPGVAITVASPALQGIRMIYSYANGDYNVPALPPGQYTVTFEMEGMARQTKSVTVGLARTERLDAAMQMAAVSEAIAVTAAAPSVLETTEVQANYDAGLVDELPIGRTIQAVTLFAPGVRSNRGGGNIVIAGAPSYDNLYLVNGAVTNANLGGESDSLFIEDAIQETSVLIGSISAEYGRFTGGVVSAITKSGGNELSGSFRDSFTNPAWSSASAYGEPDAGSTLDETYEATLGGRIMRDRLWFFLAGRYADPHYELPYFASSIMRPVIGIEDERNEVKLTGQITPRQTLTASYLDMDVNQTNTCYLNRCWEESAIDPSRSIPRELATARYNGSLSRNGFGEAGFSTRRVRFLGSGGDHLTTDFDDPRDIALGTPALKAGTNFPDLWGAPVFSASRSVEIWETENALLKGTYYLATEGSGTHNIVAGYERFAESRLANNFQSGSNFLLYFNSPPKREADGTLRPIVSAGDIITYTPIPILSEGSDFVTDSFYVNDKWDLGAKWSFNIGLRYDRNDGADSAGHPISRDSNISPRIGAIHDFRGDGRFRVNASYSKYVSKILEGVGGANGGGNPWYIEYAYGGPTVGGLGTGLGSFDVLEEVFRWFLAQGGTNASELVVGASVPGHNIRVKNLDSPSVDEWTVGFGIQLRQNGFVRIDAINREWGDFYASFTSPGDTVENPIIDGEFLDVLTTGNTEGFSRSYRGLLIQATWRPTGRVHAGGNYTWSRSRGNDEDISGNGPFAYAEYRDFGQFNPVGFITNDQTHRGRIWLGYDLPLGRLGQANVSILENYESGRPYSARGSVSVRPYMTNPGYATPPRRVMYFFSDRGEYRWDAATSTDLALNYELPIRMASIFVQGEVLNVFNEQAQVLGDTTVGIRDPFNPFTEEPIECPQGQTECAGTNWQKDPNFGKATAPGHYQDPRMYRFSAGVRF